MLMPHLPEPDVLAALGEISVRHGFLDLILRRTIKTLAGITIAEVDKALSRTGAGEMRDLIERHAKRRLGKTHPAVLRLKHERRDQSRSLSATSDSRQDRKSRLCRSLAAIQTTIPTFRR